MSAYARNTVAGESWEDRCDTRIWSGDCTHEEITDTGDKYQCVACGKIPQLDHEVRHEIFPHIKGDTDNLY